MNPQPAPSAESLKQITHLAAALKAPRITESATRLADHGPRHRVDPRGLPGRGPGA